MGSYARGGEAECEEQVMIVDIGTACGIEDNETHAREFMSTGKLKASAYQQNA